MTDETPFARSAHWYDAIYRAKGKDYAAEVAYLVQAATRHGIDVGPGVDVLDVACGTGEHLRHLPAGTCAVGIDACSDMLAVARRKVPGAAFRQCDMRAFSLGRRFDVVTCLFSSTGYLDGPDDLARAVAAMARHRRPGGLLLIEPPVLPERLRPPQSAVVVVQDGGLTLRRETHTSVDGDELDIRFRFSIGSPGAARVFLERHRVRLYRESTWRAILAGAGLAMQFDPHGPSGLGMVIGTDTSSSAA